MRTLALSILFAFITLVKAKDNASPTGEPVETRFSESGRWCFNKATTDKEANDACKKKFLPNRPVPEGGTNGAFFIGYAWGENSKQLVYGPQVGVSGTILFPLVIPNIEQGYNWYDTTWNDSAKSGVKAIDTSRSFQLPHSATFTMDLATSLTTSLASFSFPTKGTSTNGASTEVGVGNLGLYFGPELGSTWWDDNGKRSRITFTLGILIGYINTTATGPALVIGIQPSLNAQF